MKRKVIGYEKALNYLQRGYGITISPLGQSTYIYDKEHDEFISVRHDVVSKMLRQSMLTSKAIGWSTIYYLKGKEVKDYE